MSVNRIVAASRAAQKANAALFKNVVKPMATRGIYRFHFTQFFY